MAWSLPAWNPEASGLRMFQKRVSIQKGSCRDTPQLIYINVTGNRKNSDPQLVVSCKAIIFTGQKYSTNTTLTLNIGGDIIYEAK